MQPTMSIANLLIAALAASPAAATPLTRRQLCNSVPPMAADASVKPLSEPVVATADLCREACEASKSCQAYVFGLPPSVTMPKCMLFAVPAAQVPTQGFDELHVFDKACSDIPTVAPTHAAPQGTLPPANTGSSSNNNNNNGQGQQDANGNNGKAAAAQKRDTCNVAPTGPSTNAPAPLQTLTTPADLPACLALCKANPSCKSVEFGKPAPGQSAQCILFSVPASELPPPASGVSIVASDVGC